jgi:hypothetical protein
MAVTGGDATAGGDRKRLVLPQHLTSYRLLRVVPRYTAKGPTSASFVTSPPDTSGVSGAYILSSTTSPQSAAIYGVGKCQGYLGGSTTQSPSSNL